MPNIKGKKFPYTKEGIKASKEYAESDARERSENYQFGGMVLPPEGRGLPGQSIMGSSGFDPFGRRGRRRNPGMPPPIYKKGGKVKK
tara:strand:+ start:269 stop:529 length:261 start_codon:yes stop_codon:yes gene_type:complete